MNSKDLSKQQYTQHAEGYVTNATHARGAELGRLLELAQPQAEWRVLDVATGGGHTALKFAPHVASVIATDLTPRMIEVARDHITGQGVTNVQFEVADAEALPFENEQFDLVTCRIAPHHFPNIQAFVDGAARVLKADGILLVQDQVVPEDDATARLIDAFERRRDPSHHRVSSEAEWRSMFENAGFIVEHTEQLTKRHPFIHWAKMQGCDDATIAELVAQVTSSPDAVREWLAPQRWRTPDATFINHHVILKGRKPR